MFRRKPQEGDVLSFEEVPAESVVFRFCEFSCMGRFCKTKDGEVAIAVEGIGFFEAIPEKLNLGNINNCLVVVESTAPVRILQVRE